MHERDRETIQFFVHCAAVGGFFFMALAAWGLLFDVSALASMIAGVADANGLSAMLIGGMVGKGAVVGAVLGLACLTVRQRSVARPASVPVTGDA